MGTHPSLWLARLGAKVRGFALAPASSPNLYTLGGVADAVDSIIADINDRPALERAFAAARPAIVLHLAAQALVRNSYINPVETFATNVTGVVALLDIARASPDVAAVVIVTSNKCYENNEWVWGYRETDRLGGHDPYSASKG